MINQFLSRFNPEEASSKTITFSYLTTPQIFQMSVEVRRAATQARHVRVLQRLFTLAVRAGDVPQVFSC